MTGLNMQEKWEYTMNVEKLDLSLFCMRARSFLAQAAHLLPIAKPA